MAFDGVKNTILIQRHIQLSKALVVIVRHLREKNPAFDLLLSDLLAVEDELVKRGVIDDE